MITTEAKNERMIPRLGGIEAPIRMKRGRECLGMENESWWGLCHRNLSAECQEGGSGSVNSLKFFRIKQWVVAHIKRGKKFFGKVSIAETDIGPGAAGANQTQAGKVMNENWLFLSEKVHPMGDAQKKPTITDVEDEHSPAGRGLRRGAAGLPKTFGKENQEVSGLGGKYTSWILVTLSLLAHHSGK